MWPPCLARVPRPGARAHDGEVCGQADRVPVRRQRQMAKRGAFRACDAQCRPPAPALAAPREGAARVGLAERPVWRRARCGGPTGMVGIAPSSLSAAMGGRGAIPAPEHAGGLDETGRARDDAGQGALRRSRAVSGGPRPPVRAGGPGCSPGRTSARCEGSRFAPPRGGQRRRPASRLRHSATSRRTPPTSSGATDTDLTMA